ncbi:MAG: methyltransferase [bacterium]|jgi:SAM-dependent methyltransferase|nr:methyltransferase [bacterium]
MTSYSAAMTDPYAHLAERFVAHYDTLRGAVRAELVAHQLDAHMPRAGRVIDVGGGAGRQAIRLARLGHEVTLLDPSEEMLARAREVLQAEPAHVQARMTLILGTGEDAPKLLEASEYPVVLCHAVLPYVENPEPLLRSVAALAAADGVVSVLAKNADALALRPALEGRFADAVSAFDADADRGGLGVSTRAHSLDRLVDVLAAQGVELEAWYGIRVFTDHLGSVPPGQDFPDVLEAERRAGEHDPYRRVARCSTSLAADASQT